MKRIRRPSPALIISIVALIFALTGSAIAGLPGPLKLGQFNQSSRDRLAGTGVIQFARANHVTPAGPALRTYAVQCELAKKATAGGWKWEGLPPNHDHYRFAGAWPTGGGFTVKLWTFGATAFNKPLDVFANCVKSRKTRGTPPPVS